LPLIIGQFSGLGDRIAEKSQFVLEPIDIFSAQIEEFMNLNLIFALDPEID
jgi:hypothetical protein